LRALIKSNAKVMDLLLPYDGFACNKAPSKTTGMSPFKVVYGTNPLSPLDLMPRATDDKPNMEASKRVVKRFRNSTSKSRLKLRNQMPPIELKQTSTRKEWCSTLGI